MDGRKRVTLRISLEFYEALKQGAKVAGIPLNTFLLLELTRVISRAEVQEKKEMAPGEEKAKKNKKKKRRF